MRKTLWAATICVCAVAGVGCDPPRPAPPQTTGQTTAAAPFHIEPTLWGTTADATPYEVRQLPDGSPGLFTADGALLVQLLPELIVDVAEAGKKRPKPTTRRFELVKVEPIEGGGFTLYATLKHPDGHDFDLRVENGPHDPRVHVGLTTRWSGDVELYREIVRFRTGPFTDVTGLGHDYDWNDVAEEWVGPVHAPHVVKFGQDALTAVGRIGVEDVVVRAAQDRWDLDVEMYHYENHPIEVGDACGQELDGAAPLSAGTRSESRFDFVVGPANLPIVARYPTGLRAAVALAQRGEEGARALVVDGPASSPTIAARPALWLGASVEKLPCDGGRFAALKSAGIAAMWSGTTILSDGPDLLAPTETDARRVFAFRHPAVAVPTLFELRDRDPDPGWFDPQELAKLKAEHGMLVAHADLEAFLGRDASATKTVREALAEVASGPTVWITGPGELATRLLAVSDIDLEFLPEGVVRVRNGGAGDVDGLSLILPDGMAAQYETGVVHTNGPETTWFDLAAGGDQLLQLRRGNEPAWPMKPANIVVSYEPSAGAP